MVNKRFEDLNVWRRSALLCENVFLYFNSKKCYQFKDHISRTVLSISSNIAEGFERGSDREFIRFLIYAKGSCGEFRSQTIIGINTNYIDAKTGNKWKNESIEISSMLTGLIKTRKLFLIRDLNEQKK
jgi:four helix bundle protein